LVWDLRGALLKKQEVESAHLADFEFRLRARTMRLLAGRLDGAVSAEELIPLIALHDDQSILADLSARYPAIEDLHHRFDACRADARGQLIAELGDPTPHRLA
jgi:hypothetical protein